MKKEASSKEAPDGTTEASTGEDENLRQSLLQAGEFHLDFDLLDDEELDAIAAEMRGREQAERDGRRPPWACHRCSMAASSR